MKLRAHKRTKGNLPILSSREWESFSPGRWTNHLWGRHDEFPLVFPLSPPSFRPRVARVRNCNKAQATEKSRRDTVLLSCGLGKGAPENQKVWVKYFFFSSFFLFQLRPKVSVSHGAARQWQWQKKHWKPHTITYHCKHRNRGERPCHLKSAGEPVIFFSLFLTVWPHGWPQSCRTAWQYNGKNFNRNLSLRP